MTSTIRYQREYFGHMMKSYNAKTWLDTPLKESTTKPERCPVYTININPTVTQPEVGTTLSEYIKEKESDPEIAELLKRARCDFSATAIESDGGETVKSLRLKLGLSQAQLAARAKTQQSHIARIESGRDTVAFDTLCKLQEALEVDYNTLVAAVKKQISISSREKS